METGKVIKISVIVLGFGAAGIIYAMTRSGGDIQESKPDDVGMVDLVCVDSGAHIQLPFDQVRAVGMKPRGGRARASREPAKEAVVIYPAPECGSAGAVLADFCQECKKYYPRLNPDGTPGHCPECGRGGGGN